MQEDEGLREGRPTPIDLIFKNLHLMDEFDLERSGLRGHSCWRSGVGAGAIITLFPHVYHWFTQAEQHLRDGCPF